MQIKLIVIRTSNLDEAISFYEKLGMQFHYHRHGRGVFHYSAKIGDSVFEIYPLSRFQKTADDSTRLGFTIDDFDKIIGEINDEIILSRPKETEWGRMAVVKDPDGRRIELYAS